MIYQLQATEKPIVFRHRLRCHAVDTVEGNTGESTNKARSSRRRRGIRGRQSVEVGRLLSELATKGHRGVTGIYGQSCSAHRHRGNLTFDGSLYRLGLDEYKCRWVLFGRSNKVAAAPTKL